MFKLSLHKLAISATWDILPLASFMYTMLLILDKARHVSGNIFKPVLLGTLYKIIGRVVSLAIVS